MPYCPQCGIDNPDSARFCDQCGAALIAVNTSPNATTQPAYPAVPPPVSAATVPPPSAGVVCPQCGTSAIPGEAFCDNCGAPLSAPASASASVPAPPSYSAGIPAQPMYPPPQPATPPVQQTSMPPIFSQEPAPVGVPQTTPQPTLPPRHLPPLPEQPTPPIQAAPPRAVLAPARLVVASSGVVLPLPSSARAIVGRSDKVSNFYPEVDLLDHGALDGGVGRRHLRLSLQNGQVVGEDMDSTNGTLINGQKLAPRQPQPLRDGDTIQLGKLILRYSDS